MSNGRAVFVEGRRCTGPDAQRSADLVRSMADGARELSNDVKELEHPNPEIIESREMIEIRGQLAVLVRQQADLLADYARRGRTVAESVLARVGR